MGTGARHELYRWAIGRRYADRCELVGLCDTNTGRLQRAAARHREDTGVRVPAYAAGDFDRMLADVRPDRLVVTSIDSSHDDYICRALDAGCDVITEKPMTIDAARCRRVLATRAATGGELQVTFNYRYSPPRLQVRELLGAGVIGEILAVDFHWLLDTHHGADYFRRWHRQKANSGGLLVHKATHHFDLVNWWIGAAPSTVYATGDLRFYRPQTATRLGLSNRGERCLACPAAERCDFRLDLESSAGLRAFYLDHEEHDGYYRDRCVFSDEIDIEDTVSVVAHYDSGARLTYSLHAMSPWEGYTITFTGTLGRLEHTCQESVYVHGDGRVPGAPLPDGTWTRIHPLRGDAYEVPLATGEGAHGGGDLLLMEDLFAGDRGPDPLGRRADHRAGAWSILTGIAANESIRMGIPIRIADLVPPEQLR